MSPSTVPNLVGLEQPVDPDKAQGQLRGLQKFGNTFWSAFLQHVCSGALLPAESIRLALSKPIKPCLHQGVSCTVPC